MPHTYGPSDFAAVTDGWIDQRMLQNWRADDVWLTPTPPASPGPYPHGFGHLVEAAIVAELDRTGIAHKTARAIIERRLVDRAFEIEESRAAKSGRPRRAVDRGDMSEAIVGLPEFESTKDIYWVAVLRTAKRGALPYVQAAMAVPRQHIGQSIKAADGDAAASAIVLNVSKIVARVRAYVENKRDTAVE